jgi:outer membrane protein TolC
VLVGTSPSEWTAPAFALDALCVPRQLSLSVPSELVRVRPDIRAAEAQLHGAAARVGIATADLYPRITRDGRRAGSCPAAPPMAGASSAVSPHRSFMAAR